MIDERERANETWMIYYLDRGRQQNRTSLFFYNMNKSYVSFSNINSNDLLCFCFIFEEG